MGLIFPSVASAQQAPRLWEPPLSSPPLSRTTPYSYTSWAVGVLLWTRVYLWCFQTQTWHLKCPFFLFFNLKKKFGLFLYWQGMSFGFLGGVCILKTSTLITWPTGVLGETWVLCHLHPLKQLLSALVAPIMLLLLNKSHSMQRCDKWFSGHPLYCGSWGIAGNTPLALGYLGDSPRTGILELASCWDSFAHSTPQGLKLLCGWALWALFPPKHLQVSSPCGSDSWAPRASSELHVPVCCLCSSSSLRSHEISLLPHPLGNKWAMHNRVNSTPWRGMTFCGEACGGKVNGGVTSKKWPALPVRVLSLIRVTHSDLCTLSTTQSPCEEHITLISELK